MDDLLLPLHQLLALPGRCYIVLDALDECVERNELFRAMEEIVNVPRANVQLLVTSRREKDIADALDPLVTRQICIASGLVHGDIKTHIDATLRTDSNLKKWPADVKGEIESALLDQADGM